MELVGQSLDQLEDLGLDRDVQCRRRLVCEDQLRIAGQRDRDHHALAHTARELVRVVVVAVLGPRDANLAQEFRDAIRCRLHGRPMCSRIDSAIW